MSDPFFMPREMGLSDEAELVDRLKRAGYAARFAAAFPESPEVSMTHVQTALVAYVRSLSGDVSRYRRPASEWGLQGAAKHGMQVFFGKAQCGTCHAVSPDDGRFTDDRFHPSALGTQAIAPQLAALVTEGLADHASGQQLGALVGQRKDLAELGHFLVSGSPADINTFRTPSLLNVADTAPYMHDGSVTTLEKAVDLEIYYRSLQSGRPLHLTEEERQDVIAFLKALHD
ncbi:hypothetical protein GCM10011408_22370 [Dyella caseinilytica]|nr:hypothetical protein GCM10011408_22370 [Dyella caseinilytica]